MTLITFEDGKAVFRDGKVGTEQACCCGGDGDCNCVCNENDYAITVEIEGETIQSGDPPLELCRVNGDPLESCEVGQIIQGASTRRVSLATSVDDQNCLLVSVAVQWDGVRGVILQCTPFFFIQDTSCSRTITYNYRFTCDDNGCPGDAELVSTDDTGENNGGDPSTCPRDCETITAPTSVTATHTTCCEFP